MGNVSDNTFDGVRSCYNPIIFTID